jgi:hypothetical protein
MTEERQQIIVGVAGEHAGTIGITLALSDGRTVAYTIPRKAARRLAADLDRAIADSTAREGRQVSIG